MTFKIWFCCSVSQEMFRGKYSEATTTMDEAEILAYQLIAAVRNEQMVDGEPEVFLFTLAFGGQKEPNGG